jgi:hypothetical protein
VCSPCRLPRRRKSLADLKGRYGVRHPDIDEIWMESFERVAALVPPGAAVDDKPNRVTRKSTHGCADHSLACMPALAPGLLTG